VETLLATLKLPAAPVAPTAVATVGVEPTPAVAGATAVAADCAGADVWLATTRERIRQVEELAASITQQQADPQAMIDTMRSAAAEFGLLAEAQRGTAAPAMAATVNEQLAAALAVYAEALPKLLDSLLAQDQAGAEAAIEAITEADISFADVKAEVDRIAAACESTP
jgi:hypothetical protein